MSDLLKRAHDAVALAKKHGADDVVASIGRSRGVELEWRDGKMERVQDQTTQGLSLRLYVNGRYSANSTNDLRPEALDAFVGEAVAMTQLLEPDPHRNLPDPSMYEGRADVDLDLVDDAHKSVTSSQRMTWADELETLVREQAPEGAPIVSVATGVSDGYGERARVHSNGFEGYSEGTTFSRWTQITLKDEDGRRPAGFGWTASRHLEDLDDARRVATDGVARAMQQLGAGKLNTGRYTVIVENRALGRLIGALLGPLSGAALQQKQSLWDGKLDTQIVSDKLTLVSEPHIVRGLGSALWDGDGFATKERPILENGVLKTYFIDHYYGNKMGVAPTTSGYNNLRWSMGDKGLAELVSDVGEGVLIDRFLGGNSNGTTGEISLGCGGRRIVNGQLEGSVQEVNLSGHFGEIWSSIVAIGNDPMPSSSSRCPSVVFEGIQLSGV
ncbi:MAG: TldD/PmbA family protein [Bradymonadia bacterium]